LLAPPDDRVLSDEAETYEVQDRSIHQTKSLTKEEGKVVEVHVSLSDESGESDLVVVFEARDASRFDLLIEDKIDAVFQQEQLERYLKRGEQGISSGRWSKFVVVLFAPAAYIEKSPTAKQFEARLSYEDIAAFLRSNLSGRRGSYRGEFLESAAPKGATAYVRIKDKATDRYWTLAHELARKEFPELEMRKPDFARNATWVVFRPKDFPSHVHVDLKGNKGFIDLTFSGVSFARFEHAVSHLLQDGMSVHQAGRSAVVRFHVSHYSWRSLSPDTENALRDIFRKGNRFLFLLAVSLSGGTPSPSMKVKIALVNWISPGSSNSCPIRNSSEVPCGIQ
jgi:hypothetical protein